MDDVQYIRLRNSGGLVARIHILYKTPHDDGSGNISYPAEFSEWTNPGYADICAAAERTLDLLKDANMTDGTIVKLRALVPLGKSRESSEQYIFQSTSGKTALYNISGTPLTSHLNLESYG